MPSVSRRYPTGRQRFERPSGCANEELRAPVVLMVSGGADSTALLVLAATSALDIDDGRGASRIARERLHVLHVNHQLRGIDAEEDEEFVRGLADRFGIPCTVCRADVAALAVQGDGNVENAGRELRYREANRLANSLSAEFGTPRSAARILTAHTANDRAETFFMNAIRGTGTSGLSSIPRRRNRIVRPLLDRTHEELCDLLRMRGIVWREDQTNSDTRYLRSFVRHEIMPTVLERNPRVMASLANTCDILSEEDAYLTAVSSRTLRELTRRSGEGTLALDAARLAACEVAIARRVVRQAILTVCPDARLEARHVAAVLATVAAGAGSAAIPMGADARVEHGLLLLRARDAAPAQGVTGWLDVPVGEAGRMELPDGRVLLARLMPAPEATDVVALARAHGLEWAGESVLLDAQAAGIDASLGGRLWVDVPHPGDVLCPLGMHGQSKKLSDLLGEARVPVAERAAQPVVHTSPTGSVVWVAGIRADERMRCTPQTKQLLELRILPAGENSVR